MKLIVGFEILKNKKKKIFQKRESIIVAALHTPNKKVSSSSNTGIRMLYISYKKRCCVTWNLMFPFCHGVPI